ncbi:RNA methyltransferase [Verrucomicrobia bacterium IMCC26134]|jgi:16S rRNA (cytosine967-C5)-methyltransferase|nr:RNA methyltransferase [Verrucomicrobia bacterium IMCC26134]
MSPLATRAANIIAQVSPDVHADFALKREFANDPDLTPQDKRDLTRAVFAYYRWFRWFDHTSAVASRVNTALDLQRKFESSPSSVNPAHLSERALPAWALASIDFPSSAARTAYLLQLQREPALWLRPQRAYSSSLARILKPNSAPQSEVLNFKFQSAALSPTALRYEGQTDLFRTDEFKQGLFEIQDFASQLVGHACAPLPSETWWDACAGEGGKMLHLSDLMDNKGLIWASDRHTGRLATLRKRAGRAKAFNYRPVVWTGGPILPTKTKFDGILVDAPCSGVGTWQRNPHARWSTTETDVKELAEIQLLLLENTRKALKPGGRLIYAVCTITRQETTDVVRAFSLAHPELEPIPLLGLPAPKSGPATGHFLWPQELNANGMFIAAWRAKTA